MPARATLSPPKNPGHQLAYTLFPPDTGRNDQSAGIMLPLLPLGSSLPLTGAVNRAQAGQWRRPPAINTLSQGLSYCQSALRQIFNVSVPARGATQIRADTFTPVPAQPPGAVLTNRPAATAARAVTTARATTAASTADHDRVATAMAARSCSARPATGSAMLVAVSWPKLTWPWLHQHHPLRAQAISLTLANLFSIVDVARVKMAALSLPELAQQLQQIYPAGLFRPGHESAFRRLSVRLVERLAHFDRDGLQEIGVESLRDYQHDNGYQDKSAARFICHQPPGKIKILLNDLAFSNGGWVLTTVLMQQIMYGLGKKNYFQVLHSSQCFDELPMGHSSPLADQITCYTRVTSHYLHRMMERDADISPKCLHFVTGDDVPAQDEGSDSALPLELFFRRFSSTCSGKEDMITGNAATCMLVLLHFAFNDSGAFYPPVPGGGAPLLPCIAEVDALLSSPAGRRAFPSFF